jgi:hypothetical protein
MAKMTARPQIIFLWLLLLLPGCTPGIMQCFLSFKEVDKTYNFKFSKKELKDRIVDSYSYNESLLAKNLGKTVVESESVNEKYRKSVDVWLDKSNWDEFKSEIRNNTPDTLNIIIGKHTSRKHIKLIAIILGDDSSSSLTIKEFDFYRRRACKKESEYYKVKLSERISKEFINKIERSTAHNKM